MNEIEGLANIGVWESAPRAHCTARTGRGTRRDRWVDINKGDDKQKSLQVEARGDGESEDARRECWRGTSCGVTSSRGAQVGDLPHGEQRPKMCTSRMRTR